MNQEYMKTRKILPLVLSMSLPMVISMAVNALYNIVDSYFVAKISEDAMTALALVFPMQNLVNAIVIGFAIGINARVAFYLGAKEEKLADESASVGLLLNLIHGLVLALLCSAIMPSFLRMFTGDTQVIALACTYSTRVFAFAPVIGLGLAYEKIFQAVGRMKVSMICMMLGCVTNIILDPVMIFGLGPVPKLGIAGAAYATGIGQCVTLAGYLLFYFARPMHVKVNVANMKTTGSVMKNIYTIGIPATLNLALPSIQVSALNAILAPFPGSYILVLGVYYKLQTFIYLTANGIVQGIRPLVGYNYGAGEYDRVKKITDPNRTNRQFLPRHESQQVKTISPKHTQPIRKMCQRDMLIQHLTHMPYQLIHLEIKLVDIIVCIDQKPDKRHDITYVYHRLPVIPLPHHQKLSTGNLTEQIIHIPPVPLLGNHCRRQDTDTPVRMKPVPFFQSISASHLFFP